MRQRMVPGRLVSALLLAFVGSALCACQNNAVFDGAWRDDVAVAPPPLDLPDDPEPGVRYCKEWVKPTYRAKPKLVRVGCASEKKSVSYEYELRAKEVLVKPRTRRKVERAGISCNQEVVQTKPGGFRWERARDCEGGNCWEYKERMPEFKWCNKKIRENGVEYCVEDPPEYKTVVEKVRVKRTRREYVPPKYKVKMTKEVYKPGHYRWVRKGIGGCTKDHRIFSKPIPGGALDCDCPTTN